MLHGLRLRAKARKLDKSIDEATKAAIDFGANIAAVMMIGRQPDRLFTTAEVEKACDVAVAELRRQYRETCAGVPREVLGPLEEMFVQLARNNVRRGLYANLPASALLAEGTT